MATRKYTRDELLHLKESPLVTKPDNLPAIEQWLEYVYVDRDSREKLRIPHSEAQQQQAQNVNQNKRQPQRGTAAGEAAPMGNFGAGSRPGLTSMRSHGGSRTGDDVSLGPPKTVFASTRNAQKFGDGEKNGDGNEVEGPRSRFFGDKSNRKSMNDKEGGQNRDSWTRRGIGGDEEKPESRWGRRDKDAAGEKRNGYGDRHEARWGERRQNGERQGGWRDREREKRDPEWSKPEREPEWMDDPAPPNAEDDLRSMGMPRNQEQFQKWKEAMSGKKSTVETPAPEPEPTPSVKETTQKSMTAPLKLEGVTDKPFGGWGESRPAVTTPDAVPAPAKAAAAKGKGSRFASMFKESQPKEEPPPPPPPDKTGFQNAAANIANGTAEDEAGFKRILQMLGNTNVSQPTPAAVPDGPASPQPKSSANGTVKQKSRFTGFFDQGAGPKSPERIQSPPEQVALRHPEDIFASSRGMPQEDGGMFGGPPSDQRGNNQPPSRMRHSMTSPEPPPGLNGGNQRPQSGRMNDLFLDQPPSRGAATPDINIQNLLAAQRAQRPQGQDKNSEFLLNLLQQKGSSRPSSQQARPENFPLWLDQPPNMPEPHAPKPGRMPPPPGLFEDQLLRNAPPEPQRQEPQHPQMYGDIPQRRQSQRAAPSLPPGFLDEQSVLMRQQQQEQQRRFFEQAQHQQQQPQLPQQQQPGRRMSGHPNLPQMQIPPGMPQQQPPFPPGGPPPEFLQSPTNGPPPGFNPHMARHPPGLGNIPNIFQAPQQQQQQGRTEPLPGFGGMQSPPGVPPGFYQNVPTGFGAGGMRDGMAVGGGAGRGRAFEGYEGVGGVRR